MPAYRTTISFRDEKGQTAKTGFYTVEADLAAAAVAADAVVNAIAGLSVAAVQAVHGPAERVPGPITYGGAGKFSSIEDKAELVFTDAAGAVHRYQIPAPKDAVFLADDESVNPANALVIAARDAMTDGTTGSRSGVLNTGYLGGIRIRRKTQRRFAISTKNPALDGPGL